MDQLVEHLARLTQGASLEALAASLGVCGKTLESWLAGRSDPSRLARREIERFIQEIENDETDNVKA